MAAAMRGMSWMNRAETTIEMVTRTLTQRSTVVVAAAVVVVVVLMTTQPAATTMLSTVVLNIPLLQPVFQESI